MAFFNIASNYKHNYKVKNKEIYFNTNNIISNNGNRINSQLIYSFPNGNTDFIFTVNSKIKLDLSYRVRFPCNVNNYLNDAEKRTLFVKSSFWFLCPDNEWYKYVNNFFTKLEYSLDEGNTWNWLYSNDNGEGGTNIGIDESNTSSFNSNIGFQHVLVKSFILDNTILNSSNKIRFRFYGYGSRYILNEVTPCGGDTTSWSFASTTWDSWICPNNSGMAGDLPDNFFKMHAIITEFKQ